ncbi:Rab family GTPase [Martiniozyma asiatica (nom. inval.)]|nr:Rab family GTPase [Martiniozyma asiatica]
MLSKFKLVFLGDQGVGKTSLLTRFMYDTFDTQYAATVGIDFLSKTMYINDTTIRLQLWDTAGQERFRSLIPSYIRDSHVAVIVYDVSNRKSFEDVEKWLNYVKSERGSDVIIVLVGNKNDLDDERKVTTDDAEKLSEKLGCSLFMETSSKNGYGVKPLFKKIAKLLPVFNQDDLNENGRSETQTIDVAAPTNKKVEGENCAC